MSATRSKLFEFSDVAVTPLGLVIFSSVDVLVHIANGLIKQSREFARRWPKGVIAGIMSS